MYRMGLGKPRRFVVTALSQRETVGRLWLAREQSLRCALGRSGARVRKRESDGATPIGTWRIESAYYRRDKIVRPRTILPMRPIRASDGWCDDPADRNYNRLVRLPYTGRHENLSRADDVYDIVLVLDHNRRPRRPNGGSAIFVHLARPGFMPTEGCIALAERDLRRLLILCRASTAITVRL